MKTNRSVPDSPVVPVLTYPDVRAAVSWLTEAFDFVERLKIGDNHRSQLRMGDGYVIIADVRGDRRPPRSGETTHSVMVRVEDVGSHFDRARQHGAQIVMEPTEFEFGEKQYSAVDPYGHQWTFTETLRDVAPAEWGGTVVDPPS